MCLTTCIADILGVAGCLTQPVYQLASQPSLQCDNKDQGAFLFLKLNVLDSVSRDMQGLAKWDWLLALQTFVCFAGCVAQWADTVTAQSAHNPS